MRPDFPNVIELDEPTWRITHVRLRIFPDGEGQMNLSVLDTRGELLAVSQFTLYGDTRRGRRPGWSSGRLGGTTSPR